MMSKRIKVLPSPVTSGVPIPKGARPTTRGPRSPYPFATMQPGDSFFVARESKDMCSASREIGRAHV